jgi:hypothetical protein
MENPNQISVTDANASSVKRDKFTRRGFLGIGSAALAIAVISPAMAEDRSRSDPDPGNPVLDAQNPDSMWPPSTDSKSLIPTFKYPFSFVQEQRLSGPLAFGVADPHPPELVMAHLHIEKSEARRTSEGGGRHRASLADNFGRQCRRCYGVA